MEPRKVREKDFHDDINLNNRREDFGRNFYFAKFTEPITKCFWEKLGDLNAKQVLDYGCGTGSNSIRLVSYGANVVGIDISSLRIAKAKQAAEKMGLEVQFVEGDAECTNFEDNTFDIVTGGAILHHLNMDSAAKEIHRILKPEGKAVFIEPLGMNPLINIFRKLTPKARSVDEHPLKTSDFNVLRKCFSGIEIYYFVFLGLLYLPIRMVFKRDFELLLKFIQGLDDKALKIKFLQKLAWQVVLVLHKSQDPNY